jgi:hypothetical protein
MIRLGRASAASLRTTPSTFSGVTAQRGSILEESVSGMFSPFLGCYPDRADRQRGLRAPSACAGEVAD